MEIASARNLGQSEGEIVTFLLFEMRLRWQGFWPVRRKIGICEESPTGMWDGVEFQKTAKVKNLSSQESGFDRTGSINWGDDSATESRIQNDMTETIKTEMVKAEGRRISVGALLGGVAIGVVLVLAILFVVHGRWWSGLTGFVLGRGTHVDVSAPAVVDRIRQLLRLETVVFSLDKIVVGERESPYLPNFLAGEKMLLIAHGEVTAGVDLSGLKPGDVTVDNGAVQVKLPVAEVLSTRLDNAKTKVYSRETGLLVSADPNLETQARQAAEDQITKAAVEDGILDKARENARANVTALLQGLGFKSVRVE
jgi:hypothetical protein